MENRLEGNLVRLRPMTAADLAAYHHWRSPGHAWYETDGPYYPKPTQSDVDAEMIRLRQAFRVGEVDPFRPRLVIADRATDVYRGMVNWYWESEETKWAQIGIVIMDDEWRGRGAGFEALGLWTQYLFDTQPDWVRLDLRTWSGNIGMVRVAEKVGYQEEARFRMARIVNGSYYDGLGFGVLRTEWDVRYPNGFAAEIAARHP